MSNIKPQDIEFTGADNNKLSATEHRSRSDRVAVLLHGGGQTRHSWQGTAKRLADAGITAITVDLRGHGESDWLEDQSYTFFHFAADVTALAREVKSRYGVRPVIVGASLGGLSALMAEGEADGPLLEALILVDITPKMDPNGVKKIHDFMGAHLKDGFGSIEEAADAVSAYMPHRAKPKSLDGLNKNLRLGSDGRYRWHWDPAFAEGPLSIKSDRDEMRQRGLQAVGRLKLPVLLIRGARSELVSEEHAREFLQMVPHARYVDVAEAGHMVAGDKNDIFTSAVMDFLESDVEGEPVSV
ncbi:MAG: alpha/beta hydrolase [Pseudomonadota bacterium]